MGEICKSASYEVLVKEISKMCNLLNQGKLPFELHFISWGFLEGYNIILTFYVNLKSLKDYKVLVSINN